MRPSRIRLSTKRLASLLVGLLLAGVLTAACGRSSSPGPQPTRSPEPTFSQDGKPGGTLRIVGTVRDVPLDPALARDDASLLVDRLIYRQLYSYHPGDEDPSPDLAALPRLSGDRLTASITLGNARWNVPGGRGVTAGDVLRSLKRLCSPGVLAPERSYLSEVVVGYADFCTRAAKARLGRAGQPDLSTVDVPGLQAVGDGEIQIKLRRPASDLVRILAQPALSPLPREIADGFADPLQLVTDGPYRFVDPKGGESYRLSRNTVWDPATDRIRAALVDRVALLGGLTPADVQQRLATNEADLSWDTEAPTEVVDAPSAPTGFRLVRLPARDLGVVAVGARGPAARPLASSAARSALFACLDRPRLRKDVGAAVGNARVTVAGSLLTPASLNLADDAVPVPPASPSPSASVGASGSPTASSASGSSSSASSSSGPATPRAGSSAIPTPIGPVPTPQQPLTAGQCRARLVAGGLRPGTGLVVLSADTPAERAAGTTLQARFAAAGLAVQLRIVPAERYSAIAALGGWDLAVLLERPAYPDGRAVLGPLLDPRWVGDRTAGAAHRPPAALPTLFEALAESDTTDGARRQLGLAQALGDDGGFTAAFGVDTIRSTGSNVGTIPPLALLGNADPANVALGVTRPGESAPGPAAPS